MEELFELWGVILVCCEEAGDSGRGDGRDRRDPWELSSIPQVSYSVRSTYKKRGGCRRFGDL